MPAPSTALRSLTRPRAPARPDHVERVRTAIAEIRDLVPPVWPLADYVAVNPFQGLAHLRFLDARRLLREVRDCEMLPGADRLLERFVRGDIFAADVEKAFVQCREEYPECYSDLSPHDLTLALHRAARGRPEAERRYFTVAEAVDRRLGGSWTSHIVTDVSRQCAMHYDLGQAAWPSPWKHLPLYEAWREAARVSRRMDMLGLTGFRRFVAGLPTDPEQAVASMLAQLAVPEQHWRKFMLAELFSIAGWASYLRYRLWQATTADAGSLDEHLVGLLAMRLAYDVALAETSSDVLGRPGALHPIDDVAGEEPHGTGVLARYLFQVAAEIAYRRGLCRPLVERPAADAVTAAPASRKSLQMVFCIDVRSEVFRRHLEAAAPDVETFGFAGFFGMALEHVGLGDSRGPAQCPVLLAPTMRAHDEVAGDADTRRRASTASRVHRLRRSVWKAFQTSATSCFSFVESLGAAYLPALVRDGWQLSARGGTAPAGVRPALRQAGPDAVPLEKRIDLATGMLRNLGLVADFARVVAICGHAAEVTNNPYRAGLDCGACGGHSGEPNARIAAALLNDPAVRAGVSLRGIEIPDDTLFVAAVHCTTTDEIRLPDAADHPASHAADLGRIRGWLGEATAATRLERAADLVGAPGPNASAQAIAADILRRSRDWSEVRPEWGLANNAAFIVAPRVRTAGLDLGGRTFLHSYDHTRDPELRVLELIITAPMVVTNWINLQYFASAVDNRAFGAGNKLIHNVTGQLGVLLGNGGDLMTGLPWQSVAGGTAMRHEPLRLTVVIEAPRAAVATILDRHPMVARLVGNGWLTLLVHDADGFARWSGHHGWLAERPWALVAAHDTSPPTGGRPPRIETTLRPPAGRPGDA